MENDICNVDNIGSDDNASEVNANNRLDKEFCWSVAQYIVIEKLGHRHPRAFRALAGPIIFLAIFSCSVQVQPLRHSNII